MCVSFSCTGCNERRVAVDSNNNSVPMSRIGKELLCHLGMLPTSLIVPDDYINRAYCFVAENDEDLSDDYSSSSRAGGASLLYLRTSYLWWMLIHISLLCVVYSLIFYNFTCLNLIATSSKNYFYLFHYTCCGTCCTVRVLYTGSIVRTIPASNSFLRGIIKSDKSYDTRFSALIGQTLR